jgi:hypothetical protein
MQFKKTLLAMMMFGVASAHADYQFELTAALSQSSFENDVETSSGRDNKEKTDTDSFDLGATIYFSPVSTAKGPLAEAAFLSKASEISIDISREDLEFDDDGDKDNFDVDSNVISGQFILPNPALIFRAALGQGKYGEADTDILSLGFGGYITDHITLTLDYDQVKYDFDDYGFDSSDSIDSFTVTYKQLIEFGGESSLVLEPYLASIDVFDDNAAKLGIDATWYITRQLGLTAGISGYAREEEDGDYSEGKSSIGVDYFINENFRIGGALTSASSEFNADDDYGDGYYYDYAFDEEGDGHGVEIHATARF